MKLEDKISPHFTFREMFKSETADRTKINNITFDSEILKNLTNLCNNILEPVRNHYGVPFTPSSVYRCLQLNRLIKSSDTSQHTKGQAADFELVGIINQELFEWCRYNLDFDQLILEFHTKDEPNSGWVHCSYVSSQLNRNDIQIFYK